MFENPVLQSDVFTVERNESMSIAGTSWKILLSLVLMIGVGFYTFDKTMQQASSVQVVKEPGKTANFAAVPSQTWSVVVWGSLSAFVLAMIIAFVPSTAQYLTLFYSALEGAALGGVTGLYQIAYGDGIAIQALIGVTGVSLISWVLYATGTIRVTGGFVAGVSAAMLALLLIYFADIVLHMFGMQVPGLHDTGVMGICISVGIVCLAAASLIIDFAQVDNLVQKRTSKDMEWYAAFGILVTVVWMYLEILKLLAKLKSDD